MGPYGVRWLDIALSTDEVLPFNCETKALIDRQSGLKRPHSKWGYF